MEPEFWNQRYSGSDYVYGTIPNDFLSDSAALIPPGPVLCLADGEGRNGVFLAERGHAVTSVDQSHVGLAKAAQLAATRHVPLQTVVADLADFAIEPDAWSGIVSMFAHLPQPLRRDVHARVVAGLRPGGVLILEAYNPRQANFRTGGPVQQPELLMRIDDLRREFAGLDFVVAHEIERDVLEGTGHRGRSAVVQIIGRKPVTRS